MNAAAAIALTVAAITVGWTIGLDAGDKRGDKRGYTRATGEFAARKEEHDRIMQYVGICKWAKIMAADTRCKTELP